MKTIPSKKYILIGLSMIISAVVVHTFEPHVFVADSPRLNKNTFNGVGTAIARIVNPNNVKVQPLQYEPVSKGVYAAEVSQVHYVTVKESEVEWVTMNIITKSGKQVLYKYPKGQPPIQELLNLIENQ